jgi:GTP-binding protein Era
MVDQARSACLDVDVVLWLVEADRSVDTDPMIPRLLEKSKRPVLLVINKIDTVPKDKLLPLIEIDTVPKDKLLPLIATYSKICPFASIVPISALKGDGVDALMGEIPQLLPEGPRYFPEDQLTDVPERFIVAEMIREQILMRTKDEVPYGVAILVERFQENPARNMIGIDAVINVERDSQKGILVGKGGTMIRQIGQGARKEIERMLGVKVHLELFVRVQKNWTSSGRMMKEFGYE